MRKAILLLFLVSITSGCSTTLTSQGRSVKVVMSDPPKNCEEIRDVSAHSWKKLPGEAKKVMRNEAGELGANLLRLESDSSGTAYKCQ